MKGLFRLPRNLPFLKESLISVGIRAISALAVGKVVATSFGPAGTALFGQAMNLFTTLASIPSEALARGMVHKGISDEIQIPHREESSAMTSSCLLIIIYLTIALITSVLSITSGWLEPFQSAIGFFPMLSVFFLVGSGNFAASYFLIWRKTNLQAQAITWMSIGGFVGILVCRQFDLSFFPCLLGFLIGQTLGSIAMLTLRIKQLPAFFSFQFLNPGLMMPILKFTFALGISAIISYISQYVLVHWAIEKMGAPSVGSWMAMNRLADAYNIPIGAVANSILLPTLSGLAMNQIGLRDFLRPIFRQAQFWLIPAILLLWLCYPLLLQILYSKEFHAEPALLPWQLTGDYFRSSAYVFAVLMLAKGHTRFYFWLETGSSLLMLAGTWALFPVFGFASLFMVHAFRYFMYWSIIVFRYRSIFF